MSSRFIFEDIVAAAFRIGRRPSCTVIVKHRSLGRILSSTLFYQSRLISTTTTSTSCGILSPKWTQQALVSCSPQFPRVIACRSYQRDGGSVATSLSKVWRKRLWTVVRSILLTTGALVWFVTIVAYLSLERISVNVHEERTGVGLNALEKKLMSNFYNEKDEAVIMRKDDALDRIWKKLKEEERIDEVFGDPVYICGYSCSNKIGKEYFKHVDESKEESALSKEVQFKEEENAKKGNESEQDESEQDESEQNEGVKLWDAGCFIEGSKKVGLMKVKFEEHKKEWVPVALHLETLEKSGQVVSEVSGSLPNGIKNFTRLTN